MYSSLTPSRSGTNAPRPHSQGTWSTAASTAGGGGNVSGSALTLAAKRKRDAARVVQLQCALKDTATEAPEAVPFVEVEARRRQLQHMLAVAQAEYEETCIQCAHATELRTDAAARFAHAKAMKALKHNADKMRASSEARELHTEERGQRLNQQRAVRDQRTAQAAQFIQDRHEAKLMALVDEVQRKDDCLAMLKQRRNEDLESRFRAQQVADDNMEMNQAERDEAALKHLAEQEERARQHQAAATKRRLAQEKIKQQMIKEANEKRKKAMYGGRVNRVSVTLRGGTPQISVRKLDFEARAREQEERERVRAERVADTKESCRIERQRAVAKFGVLAKKQTVRREEIYRARMDRYGEIKEEHERRADFVASQRRERDDELEHKGRCLESNVKAAQSRARQRLHDAQQASRIAVFNRWSGTAARVYTELESEASQSRPGTARVHSARTNQSSVTAGPRSVSRNV